MVTEPAETSEIQHCSGLLKSLEYNTEINSAVYALSIVTCILNSVSAIPAVVGNIVVIAAILRKPTLRTPSNILLCSVALSDLLTGAIVQPAYVLTKVGAFNARWDLVCIERLLYVSGGFTLAGNSYLTLTAISVDKWVALHFHLRYQELITVRRVVVWAVQTWIWCLGLVAVLLLTTGVEFSVIIVSFGVLGLIINILAYGSIFKTVKRHENQIQSQLQATQHLRDADSTLDVKKLGKSTKTIFIVYNFFLLCFLPTVFVMAAYTAQGFTTSIKMAINISSTVSFLNAAINPGIYIWKIKEIRQGVKELLRMT